LRAKLLKLSSRPLCITATCFERRHRSSTTIGAADKLIERENAKTRKTKLLGASVNAARQRRWNTMP